MKGRLALGSFEAFDWSSTTQAAKKKASWDLYCPGRHPVLKESQLI
jgi:hypothetical protein